MILLLTNNNEDEVCFVDVDGMPRVLRGRIHEDGSWIIVDRRDGQYRIAREKVTKLFLRGGLRR